MPWSDPPLDRRARRILASLSTAAGLTLGPSTALANETPTVLRIESRGVETGATRSGLGFVVEAGGFVLTTYRNLIDPSSGRLLSIIEARDRSDGAAVYRASVVAVEPTLDLAILKLATKTPLESSELMANAGLRVGQEIFAPAELDGDQVLMGRLTGLNSKECYQESLTGTMYRGELALEPALAGAPVYTRDGEVVAIHTGYVPPDEQGGKTTSDSEEVHLLPVLLARNIYDSLKEKKSLRSPWTGFSVRRLNDEEAQLFPTQQGYRGGIAIESVWEGGPAAELGIREGDLLLQIGHNRIHSVADFQKWLYLYGVGHEVRIVVLRSGGELLATRYVIQERPDWAKPR